MDRRITFRRSTARLERSADRRDSCFLDLFSRSLIVLFVACSVSIFFFASPYLVAADIPEIELLNSTEEKITLRLVIPDFQLGRKDEDGRWFQTISFPECGFTAVAGEPRLPIQSTLVSIPPEAGFDLRVVQADYTRRKVDPITPMPRMVVRQNADGNDYGDLEFYQDGTVYQQNHFAPQAVAQVGKPGWIRETRVLRVQFNPVQYNPAKGEVKLYHRLVVEIQFYKPPSAPLNQQSLFGAKPRPESRTYEQILDGVLINPQSAKLWRPRTSNPPPQSILAAPTQLPDSSPLYKISITQDGMYRITYDQLLTEDIPVELIQPSTLKMSNKGKTIPIFVRGESDGTFDPGDEIIFYGTRNAGETTYFDPFSDKNVYWLSWGGRQGLRMTKQVSTSDARTARLHRRFLSRVHVESDVLFTRLALVNENSGAQYQPIRGGVFRRVGDVLSLPPLPNDSWYWATLSAPSAQEFPFQLPDAAETSLNVAVRVMLRGQTNNPADPDHHTQIWLNGQVMLEDASWDGQSKHLFESDQVSQFFLKDGRNSISIISPGDTAAGVLDQIMLNWIEVDYWQDFTAQEDSLEFTIPYTPRQPEFRAVLSNFSNPNIELYGVDGTRYAGLSMQANEERPGTYQVLFQSTQTQPRDPRDTTVQYIALTQDQLRSPTEIIEDSPSNLREPINGADYLIITHESLMPGVDILAEWRRQQGLRVSVIDVQDIYDEFNHGIFNPHAIRDFLAYAYQNWQPPAPTYVVLVGDASFDYRNGKNFVPAILVQTPRYGAAASDNQFVTFRGEDSFPDMLIGRLPASNLIDVETLVTRIVEYESNPEIGPWRKRLLMLGGSGSEFSNQSDDLITNKTRAEFDPVRVYATDPKSPIYGGAREVISNINQGAAIVNFIGHGGGSIWADNRMLGLEDVPLLENGRRLPLILSMTCFTGYFDNPRGSCLAEELMRAPDGGAIAFVGGTGLGWLLGDFFFVREIFHSVFEDDARVIGEIVVDAKIRFLSKNPGYIDLIEMFTLFGDPALELGLPSLKANLTVTPVATANEPLAISGTLTDRNFTGQAEIVIADINSQTASFQQNDPEATELHREIVNVVSGQFAAQVALPQAPSGTVSIRVYAWNETQDAIGQTTFSISQPFAKNVRLEPDPPLPAQPTHLSAEITGAPVQTVTAFWSLNGVDWNPIEMANQSGLTYKTQIPIPPQASATSVRYYIEITSQRGDVTQTPVRFYLVERRPDLTIAEKDIEWGIKPPLLLSATVRNLSGLPAQAVRVRFLDGQLDEGIVIGSDQIIEEVPANGTAVASVPWQPSPGTHQVTIVIDTPSDSQPQGTITEQNEANNSATKTFVSNRFLLTPNQSQTRIENADGSLSLSLQQSGLQEAVVITLDSKSDIPIVDQPDIAYAKLAGQQGEDQLSSYRLDVISENGAANILGTLTFKQAQGQDADVSHVYRRDEEMKKWVMVKGTIADGDDVAAEVMLPGIYALMINNDFTPPSLQLTVEHQGFIDGDYVSETPVISAVLFDANGINLSPEHIVLMKNRQNVAADEYVISISPTNTNLAFLSYTADLSAGTHGITLQAQDANGNVAQDEMQLRVAGAFDIEKVANYPNPFVPGIRATRGEGTDVAYILTSDADKVTLKVYTINGRLVTSIETLDGFAGYNEFHWNGFDQDDEELSNGVYFYKVIADKGEDVVEKTGKMAVLR